MCPITLTVIGASIGAALSTIGTGAGIAGAATAAVAAGSSAATGAGLSAAIGAGVAASATSAAGAGLAGAAAFGATAGAGIGGSALSATAIATEVVALVGVAASVYSYKQEQQQAKLERRNARDLATAETAQASDEASRQGRVLAEEKVAAVLKGARARGEAKTLLNRGSMQIAALTREADRGTQQATSLIDTKIKALRADATHQFGRAALKESMSFKANKGPSKLGLGLSIGSSLLGGVAGLAGGTLGKVGSIAAQTAAAATPLMKT